MSTLKITIKHTKSPIGLRPIHCSVNYAFLGISALIANAIANELKEVAPYILRSSADLASAINAIPASSLTSSELHFLQLDVKDFYLTGAASWLKEQLTLLLNLDPDSKIYSTYADAINFLLYWQLIRLPPVCTPSTAELLYICIYGSGMGLHHSVEFSDGSLYYACERPIFTSHIFSKFGVIR